MRRPTVLVAVATSLATLAASVAFASSASSASSASASPTPMRGETISEPLTTMIDDLSVSDTTHTGYDRDLFKTWIDADGDGCDTREEVLLGEAWRSGAYNWSATHRDAYAHDLGDPTVTTVDW